MSRKAEDWSSLNVPFQARLATTYEEELLINIQKVSGHWVRSDLASLGSRLRSKATTATATTTATVKPFSLKKPLNFIDW